MAEQIDVDLKALTLGEIEDFEEAAGMAFSALGEGLPIKALRALAWVWLRRTEPGITFEQTRELTLGNVSLKGAEEADPTPSPGASGAP